MADAEIEADLAAIDATAARLREELSEVEDPEARAMVARVFAHVEAARRVLADLEAHLERVYVAEEGEGKTARRRRPTGGE